MAVKYQITLDQNFDQTLLSRVEEVFHGENLIQTVLHAHLLIERALVLRICEKLKEPKILEEGKYGRWSFHQKIALYVGLVSPSPGTEKLLFGFNTLRNTLAHRFRDEVQCVRECLPWDGGQFPEPPDALKHVQIAAMVLLFDLEALQGVARTKTDEKTS